MYRSLEKLFRSWASNSFSKMRQTEESFPVVTIDRNGSLVSATDPALKILTLRQIHLPIAFEDIFGSLGQPVKALCRSLFAQGIRTPPTLVRVAHLPNEIYVQLSWLPRNANSETISAIVTDATELKSLETQFVQGQKMQAIGQLAGGIAHDFNNVLTAISGYCDLVLLNKNEKHPDYNDLVQISENTGRAAELVQHLLAFSRRQKLDLEALDVNDLVTQISGLLDRLVGEKVRLVLNHEDDLPHVTADRRQMEQVLMNLIVNARDAMPGGGEIVISTTSVEFSKGWDLDGAFVTPGRYISIEVIDTGTGMTREIKEKVFEPFYTTKKIGEGTGLGLSTVYGIVKQSGGYVAVETELGQGTRFTIYLPATDFIPISNAKESVEKKPTRKGLTGIKVLIVEDEEPVRIFASRALSLQGAEVVDVDSGEAALNVLEETAFVPEIVVSDIVMPGLNGPDWVQKARETHPDLKVIFVSGYSGVSSNTQSGGQKGSDFLPKPYSLAELINAVQLHAN